MKSVVFLLAAAQLVAAADFPAAETVPAPVAEWNRILTGKKIDSSPVATSEIYRNDLPGQIKACAGQKGVWAMNFDDGPVIFLYILGANLSLSGLQHA